ncbi:hypothetical protein ACFOVU_13155 [Nocardiopsis sediminis]|uniref:Uncharacterized protein n=1 Tax=Nocardiopsis sediminis TaxID=1778267 RepID=A0ABV8FQC8_9ACTN
MAPLPGDSWTPGPFGLDGSTRNTWSPEKTVLVVVHHLTAANRLMGDVVPIIETSPSIQLVYTTPPGGAFSHSGAAYLRNRGDVVLPWHQATSLRFDLAVAASLGGLEHIHAPVLSLDHGAGPGKLLHRQDGDGPAAPREVVGMHTGGLIAYGRVIPAMIGVAHSHQKDLLARTVPPAAEVAEVVGDPAFDRLVAGADRRAEFRKALGVEEGQTLVVVSSTWRHNSLLGAHSDLPRRLAAELPADEYRVITAPHPASWVWHGHRQVRAWLGGPDGRGPDVIPPGEGWQAALVAADLVIGDHGSATYYAAAIGCPVLLGTFPTDDVPPGSHTALLGLTSPQLDHGAPLLPQVKGALSTHVPERTEWYRSQLTTAPGASAALLRSAMYRLLKLPEPDIPAQNPPIAVPRLLPPLIERDAG